MGTVDGIRRLIAFSLIATNLFGAGSVLAQTLLRENPGLLFRPMVVRVIPHRIDGDDAPAGFGIAMGERDGQIYIATANHVVRDSTPDTLTERPEIVFFHERPNRRSALRLPEHL